MEAQLLVTVESASGRHVLRLPQSARVEDLLPRIVLVCEGRSDGARWLVKPLGEAVLAGDARLGGCGLFSGAGLQLIEPDPVAPATPLPLFFRERGSRQEYVGSPHNAMPP